jgi:hypothetical protein
MCTFHLVTRKKTNISLFSSTNLYTWIFQVCGYSRLLRQAFIKLRTQLVIKLSHYHHAGNKGERKYSSYHSSPWYQMRLSGNLSWICLLYIIKDKEHACSCWWYETMSLKCRHQQVYCSSPSYIWVRRVMMEWWQAKTKELGKKPVPLPLCPPQRTNPGANPSLHSKSPATKHLSYGTAKRIQP